MGDRTWASITIGGYLETVEQAEELVEALAQEWIVNDEQEAKNLLRAACESKERIEYEHSEVNYGTFEHVDAVVLGNPKLSCRTTFASGGDYDAGTKVVHEGKTYHFTGSDGGLVSRKEVVKLLVSGGAEAVLKEMKRQDALESAEVVTLITASPAVAAWLKIFGEQTA